MRIEHVKGQNPLH